jgi:hypothetical protein
MITHAIRLGVVAACVGLCAGAAVGQGPDTHIRGFADVTWHADSKADSALATNGRSSFALGQFDLYIASRLSPRLSFVSETVFESEGAEFVVDVERVIATYDASRYAHISVGKQHTPLGYWNTAYHHGTLMQPSMDRPILVRFEDDGGILPIHTVGVAVSGDDISPAHLGYTALVGNGTGSTAEADNDRTKSVTLQLRAQVTSALQLGVSGYHDRIAAGTPTLAGDTVGASLGVGIVGGHVSYDGSMMQFLAEGVHIRHSGATPSTSNGGFALIGAHLGPLMPYGRVERVKTARGDAYYAADDVRRFTLGVGRDLASTAIVRLELRQEHRTSVGTFRTAAAQIAVGF